MSPILTAISDTLGKGVEWLVSTGLLPATSILIEPAKVLFLNNAINHGVLTPLGTTASAETGKSILFLLEANPGPGLGILAAFALFGVGLSKASAPGAIIIHFLGGIHEVYFPYILMKPALIVAAIAGGATGVLTNVIFGSGLRAPASPGSIFAVLLQTANDSYLGVILSVVLSATVSFLVAGVIIRATRARDLATDENGTLTDAMSSSAAMKAAGK
jgi:PTS system mannitol-specific IIC component